MNLGNLKKRWASLWVLVDQNPAKSIIILAATLGLIMVVIGPNHRYVPDERAHFFRAYQISELHLVAPHKYNHGFGDQLPKNLDSIDASFKRQLNVQHKQWVRFDGSAVYSPVAYITSAAAIFTGRILKLPPVMLLYLARLATLATWLGLAYIAMRIAKQWAWIFGAVILLPMMIFQSVHVTADVVTVGLTMVFVASLLQALTTKRKLKHKEIVWLAVISLLLSLSKQPYFLLPLTTLAIPASRFVSTKARLKTLALFILPGVILALAWSAVVHSVDVTNNNLIANPHLQIDFILQHPLSFLHAIFNTHLPSNSYLIIESLTTPASWLGLHTVLWSVMISYGLMLFGGMELSNKRLVTLTKQQKWLIIAVGVLVFLAIDASLYLYFSVVGAPQITGLQGRYYLPLLILLLPLLKNKSTFIQVAPHNVPKVIIIGSLITFATFSFLLVHNYPIPGARFQVASLLHF